MRNGMVPAIVAIGLLASTGAAFAEDAPQKIVVGGHGVVNTPPDIVTISFTARGEGPTSDAAVKALVAARTAALAGVTTRAPATEAHDGTIRIEAVHSAQCKDDDDAPRLSVGACAVAGYIARVSITLTTGAVGEAGTITGLLARIAGADPRVDSYGLAHPDAARDRAIASAVADAEAQAKAMASAAHVRLGRVISISNTFDESQHSDEIVVTAMRAPPPRIVAPPPPIVVAQTPAPIGTAAQVTVAYAIVP